MFLIKTVPLTNGGLMMPTTWVPFWKIKNVLLTPFFSSPAIRAAHTALIVSREMNLPMHKISFSESLYDFSGEDVLEFVRYLDDTMDTVMTFGHNNACTSLAYSLADFTGDNIPTAGAVLFRFDVSLWSEITKANAEYFFPKTIAKP
ncbi:histidine phosphatase family protein [Flavobacteriaceae bacterium]|nr:histidine phosphatase family protein [Flavobacteriaceae bacterium]